jgi:hypothetical protein
MIFFSRFHRVPACSAGSALRSGFCGSNTADSTIIPLRRRLQGVHPQRHVKLSSLAAFYADT